jgi:hypothetical protein
MSDVTVPAGTFANAVQIDGTIHLDGGMTTGNIDIPPQDLSSTFDLALNVGIVKLSATTSSGTATAELIASNILLPGVSPTSWNYGNVGVPGGTSNRNFTVQNSGPATLNGSVTLVQAGSQFSIQSGEGGFSLPPGGNKIVTVRFAPTSPGAKSATLRVSSSDNPGVNPKDVPLSGTGATHIITNTSGPSGSPNPVASGGTASLSVSATDSFGHTVSYLWSVSSCPGLPNTGAVNDATLQNPTWTAPTNATGSKRNCTIQVTVSDGQGLVQVFSYFQGVSPTASSARLTNLSTRGRVETSDNVMIGGFIIGGTTSKTVLVRAVGPSLADFGVPGALVNPALQLFAGQTAIAENDDWETVEPLCQQSGQTCGDASAIAATGLAPTQPLEAAILITLPPGTYTAIVSGLGETTGVGLVDVFEVEDLPVARLTNISTRGRVETSDNVMIGGFIIEGDTSKKVLVRALGPTLGLPPFNVLGALDDPVLQVFPEGQIVPIAQNDNWMVLDPLCAPPAQTCGGPAAITATGLAPPLDQEAAILLTLPPGAYTAILSGAGGTTGVGLVDVFEVP